MIRIDSDTHFTPLDAFAGLDLKYAEQGPRVVALPTGRYRIDYPARAPHVPAHIKPRASNPLRSELQDFASFGQHCRRIFRLAGGW